MAELSRESGVQIATIKYYLREGLLHPGERTSPNQARYDETHVRRLKLVRALLDVGSLSIVSVRDVLAAIDAHAPTHGILGIAQHGLPTPDTRADDEARAWARQRVDSVAAARGWEIDPDDPIVQSLIGVLCTMHSLGHADLANVLPRYAEAVDEIARADLDYVAGLPTTESLVESAVVGTVLGDAVLTALRRLAHAHASAQRFEAQA